FVGAGGGFLIVPALVVLIGLEMKIAVGTSLAIIAVNSLTGFLGSLSGGVSIDWNILFAVTGCALLGMLLGNLLARKIESEKLKPAFGWFVLMMGTFILLKETLLK
ncbi:sulfite exporter TauE/SafE family protein, partial [bacterium]|nr:sulfite exporter TauE/SafE family protein [bacterium]